MKYLYLLFFILQSCQLFAQQKAPINDTLISVHDPFIIRKGSTYKMMVGRSEKVVGAYADRDGVPMNLGCGSMVLKGDKNRFGVGHNAVAGFDGTDYLIFHGYDAADNGRSKLRVEKIF